MSEANFLTGVCGLRRPNAVVVASAMLNGFEHRRHVRFRVATNYSGDAAHCLRSSEFRVPGSELTAKTPRNAKFAMKVLAVEKNQYLRGAQIICYYSLIIKRLLTAKICLGELGGTWRPGGKTAS
jgi:hypothetical protein